MHVRLDFADLKYFAQNPNVQDALLRTISMCMTFSWEGLGGRGGEGEVLLEKKLILLNFLRKAV